MATQTPNPGGQPKQAPPGKTGSQPGTTQNPQKDDEREAQKIPKTGRDSSSEPLAQGADQDIPTDDDEDEDEDETGKVELPGQGSDANRRDGATPPGNR